MEVFVATAKNKKGYVLSAIAVINEHIAPLSKTGVITIEELRYFATLLKRYAVLSIYNSLFIHLRYIEAFIKIDRGYVMLKN
ncbi:hypothetical protein ES676_08120 [Bizionia saleffrena]|uniref:Uncharacterized protein n=1 Tax=Bizionia saleffrena TaxID=291189 RepID=A0A8H2LEP8_9FLAO|nr:hypothetical protein [Bizionia saleffrena]TYB74140.1 hypothetical protein ES676_08120 [Bizionia saleffrena]